MPKREQVKQACLECRKTHAKCDHFLPCSRCKRLFKICQAPPPRKKRGRRRKMSKNEQTLNEMPIENLIELFFS